MRWYLDIGLVQTIGWKRLLIVFLLHRRLANGFIQIKASLLVPCEYVSGHIPYKYIVRRKAKKYSWEHLIGWGHKRNRCLQIPKGRNARGGSYFFLLSVIQLFAAQYFHYRSVTMCTHLENISKLPLSLNASFLITTMDLGLQLGLW